MKDKPESRRWKGRRSRSHPWAFRDFSPDLLVTARYRPARRNVRLRSFEQIGGIRSGRTRWVAALYRAAKTRTLYRQGRTRHDVMAEVGISRSTFFVYVSDRWACADSLPRRPRTRGVHRTVTYKSFRRDKVKRRQLLEARNIQNSRAKYGRPVVQGRKRVFRLVDRTCECTSCGRDLGLYETNCPTCRFKQPEDRRRGQFRRPECPLGPVKLFEQLPDGTLILALRRAT